MELSGGVDDVPVMFVTANVGTLFEMADVMMNIWMKEFLKSVTDRKPKFIALHCQEIGGKKATRESMAQADAFVRDLFSHPEFREYDRARAFIDENFHDLETFTALGSFYLAHRSYAKYNFGISNEMNLHLYLGSDIAVFSPTTRTFSTSEKVRFPMDLHPLAKGNRKGFLRTRWNIDGRTLDLINVHMFYDEDNLVAMETSPSQYTSARKLGLQHILNSLVASANGRGSSDVALFIFGDFNFRLDVHEVVKKLTENGIRQETMVNGINGLDHNGVADPPKARVCFLDNVDLNKLILTIEKKLFDHHENHDYVFQLDNGKWLRTFDSELSAFPDIYEVEIGFAPSYPYVEDIEKGQYFMKTRCPAWCDRVIMNENSWRTINAHVPLEYGLIGSSVCMGDHKPVFLLCNLSQHQSSPLSPSNGRSVVQETRTSSRNRPI
ncbi:Type I inositol 1,4,5-trisphosphate 5-phosphatase [Hypsibius exemplaris]|uniref:inositol-polyphosphate 5-phosphatase n=1 Tax=Hypsibius exemplaris TaxID=2072580 RepID=A0A1W0WA22_HYPEX|nr:Type I inositol 1,4,5-trisphosphate 5-phosphatase [Hypsibius exemplaris]